jgi:hypothetical protein
MENLEEEKVESILQIESVGELKTKKGKGKGSFRACRLVIVTTMGGMTTAFGKGGYKAFNSGEGVDPANEPKMGRVIARGNKINDFVFEHRERFVDGAPVPSEDGEGTQWYYAISHKSELTAKTTPAAGIDAKAKLDAMANKEEPVEA